MRKESKVSKVENVGIREQSSIKRSKQALQKREKLCKDIKKVRKLGLWSYEAKSFQTEVVNSAKIEDRHKFKKIYKFSS